MHRIALAAALAALLFTSAPAGAGGGTGTSPGKNAAFESAGGVLVGIGTGTLLTATVRKGKSKRVLAIEAMISTNSGAAGEIEMVPLVNGVAVQGGVASTACDPTLVHCTLTGTWWLDLDAAEAANPGVFKKQPLLVTLEGGALAGSDPDIFATITLSVRMEKK